MGGHMQALSEIWRDGPGYGIFPNGSRVSGDHWSELMNDTSQETKDRFSTITDLDRSGDADGIIDVYYQWVLQSGFIEDDIPDPFEDLTEAMD